MQFNGLNVTQVFAVAFVIALVLTVYAYFFGKDVGIKKLEQNMDNSKLLQLYVIRFVHYIVAFAIWGYAYFAQIVFFNDVIFAIFIVFQTLQWILFGRCIFTIIENNLLYPTQNIIGIQHSPFWRVIGMPQNVNIALICGTFLFAALRLTIWRK